VSDRYRFDMEGFGMADLLAERNSEHSGSIVVEFRVGSGGMEIIAEDGGITTVLRRAVITAPERWAGQVRDIRLPASGGFEMGPELPPDEPDGQS
jgi:hypothetical protein